jgi:hypothetical protein
VTKGLVPFRLSELTMWRLVPCRSLKLSVRLTGVAGIGGLLCSIVRT